MDDFIPKDEASEAEVKEYFGEPESVRMRRDTLALVRFDGTAITERGVEVRHNWMAGLNFDEEQYADIALRPEEARAIRAAHLNMKTGSAIFSIMTCHGEQRCPRAESCPYVMAQRERKRQGIEGNIIPIARRCPVEEAIMRDTAIALAEEFGVGGDVTAYTHQQIILELAEIEVLESRMNALLSSNYQDLTEEKIIGTTSDNEGGVVQEQRIKDVADAMKVKEKFGFRKDKLRKQLVGTPIDKREMAVKEGLKKSTSLASQTAELLQLLRVHKDNAIEVDFRPVDED